MKYITTINQSISEKNFSNFTFYKILFFILLYFFNFTIFSQEPAKKVNETEITEKKKVDKDVVSDLKATLSTDSISIELTWTPPVDEGDVVIARSNEVIDSMEKLGISDSLGKYKSDKVHIFNSFRDVNLRPGDYYYAIVLVSQVKKKNVKLFPGLNYTIIPATVPTKTNTPVETKPQETASVNKNLEIDSISNLRIKNVENLIQLTWIAPHDAETNNPKYSIYRSVEPMFNIGLMEKATKIGEVIHPETTFLDTGITSTQNVYYGVTVTIGDKEKIPLEDNKSFRKFYFVKSNNKKEALPNEEIAVVEEKKDPVNVPQKITPPNNTIIIKNLTAETKKIGIALNWTLQEEPVNSAVTYNIYQSETPIINEANGKLSENAKKVGTVNHPKLSFLHPNTDRSKTVYYAVTIKTEDGEENLILKEGQSFVKIEAEKVVEEIEPEKKKKEKKKKKKEEIKSEEKQVPTPKPAPIVEELNPDFDVIMSQYYKKEKFREALVKFKSLADRVTDDSVRGKSLFFAALSHYNLGEYNLALKILLKEEVQMNYDKERVDFYVKRCLENRGIR